MLAGGWRLAAGGWRLAYVREAIGERPRKRVARTPDPGIR
jgi:hypothetical protein